MERGRGTRTVGALAALLTVALAVVATGPWTLAPYAIAAGSLWSASGTAALGAAVVLIGAATVTVAQSARRTASWTIRLGAVGCVVAAVGVGVVLVGLRALPDITAAPVTVAIAQFTIGPSQAPYVSPSSAAPALLLVGAVGLVVLTVVGGLLRVRRVDLDTSSATRPVTAVALLGAVALAIGSTALPWSTGDDFTARTVWSTSPWLALAAAVLLAAAAATILLVRSARPVPAASVVVAVLAGLAGAAVVASRLTFLGPYVGGTTFTRLVYVGFDTPSSAALAAAKSVVYAGAGLIVLATLAAVSLSALRGGPTNLPDRPLSEP